ncbi:uncharacterized protein [Dermacentor albipictus]|uniref:uncharacterized protein n=1 Tax=Dermacentor albipictus TaxID=60249 RepID=UPI0038FC33CF
MDVYEREYGDLLYLGNKATAYQQFYNSNIKMMLTKYNFLPLELIKCRMQSFWRKLLARNPALRSRHESDVRAAKLLCSKKKPVKTRQRKLQKKARSSYKPRRRGSQKAECLTESDEDDQGDLYRTPLPGFRSKRNNRRVAENRYMPLDIQVTRHAQALAEENKRPTSSENNGEEQEHAEKLEEESSLTSHETTEMNRSGAPEHCTSDDTTGYHEEVGNQRALSTTKHLTTTHEPSFYTANTTADKQNSLTCKDAQKTAAATKFNGSDMAGIATLVHSGQSTTHDVTVGVKTIVSGLECSRRQTGNAEQLQLDTIIKEKKLDADLVAYEEKGAAQLHLHKDKGDDNDVPDHFATQTTVTISRSASHEEGSVGAAFEDSDGSKEGTPTQSNKLRQLETTLPENAVQNKPITSHSEESCRYLTSHINEGVTTEQSCTQWFKLQECEKFEGKQLQDVKSKPKQDVIKQLKESGIPVLITQPHDAATPKTPVTTTQEHDNYEATGFSRLQKTRKSSAEVINEKPQNECVSISYDRCKTDSKSPTLKSTENIQPGKSHHNITKTKKQEEPKSFSNDAPTGHKQGRRTGGRGVKKTKLSLSYLTRIAKNKKKHPADVKNKGKKSESKQVHASVLQHTAMSTANKSDDESGNDVQRNHAVVSSDHKGHKMCKRPLTDKCPTGVGIKSDKLDIRPASVFQPTTMSVSHKSKDESGNDAAATSRLYEGHKKCKKLLTDKCPADVGNKNGKLDNRQQPASVLRHTAASTANKSDDSQSDGTDSQKNVTVVSSDHEGHKMCKRPLTDKCPAGAGTTSDKLDIRPASVLQPTTMSVPHKSKDESGNDAAVTSRLYEGHKKCKKPLTDERPADVGNKSGKLDNRQQPASVLRHTAASTANKSDDSQNDETDSQKNVTVVSSDHEGHKMCKKPLTDKFPADAGNKSEVPDNRQRHASVLQHTTTSALNKSDDKSGNDVQRNAAVVSRPQEGHKISKKPLTDKCPTDVDNRSQNLKNGQRNASVLQHTTMSTSKKGYDKSGNDVQENATTVPEAHKGHNVHKKPPKESADFNKKDSNTRLTKVATKRIIQRDNIQNAAMTRHDMQKEQKEIHEKTCGMPIDSKKESGQVITSKICMERTSNARMDIMADSTACEQQQENNEIAVKEKVGHNTKLVPVGDNVYMETKAAKHRGMAGHRAIVYPKQHTRKGAVANPVALEKFSNTCKELQEDKTSSDTNAKMVMSKNFAKGSKVTTKNATATSLERQCQTKLCDRTVTRCLMSKTKVSSAKAMQEEAAMMCCDDAEAIPNEENSKHPSSPAREAVTCTESSDNVLAKYSFKTPKSVKSVELRCPQTPLKRRSLRQKNLRMLALGNGETGAALVDDKQSDPETPLGSRAKYTKQEAEKANEKRLQSWAQGMYKEHNQQIQETSKAWTENETENEEGQQSGPRSMKQQELTWSSNTSSDHPSTKQPVISTCARDDDVWDKCQQPAVKLFSQDKGNSVHLAHLSPSMKGDVTSDKQQQSDTNGDIEMSQMRSSEDLRGLTQYPTQNLERLKAAQNLSPTTDMQEDSTNEMEVDEDDDLPCLTRTLNRMQACSLYSRNEARAAVITTNTTGDAIGREPNAESALKCEKEVAKRSNREITENGEQIRTHDMTKEVRNTGKILNDPNVGTDLEASDDEDDSSILFSIDDDDEAAASDRSHSFFQMKVTPTPLNFLKSSQDRNDSESEEELFPWLTDKVEPETNKRKGKPLSENASHKSGMNRPDFKRLRFQQEDSGRQPSNATQLRTAKRVTIVDAATQETHKMYGKRQHTFPIPSYKREHDGCDHSSVCTDPPPLLSRREAEFFESDNDEDLSHDADDYEV